MNFFNILSKRRWYVYVFLIALLWFQVFLMFASREDLNAGVLRAGGVSVLMTLERTGTELVLPSKGDRSRVSLLFLLLLVKAARLFYDKIRPEPFSAESRQVYGTWEILIGKELASLPHSDMVLRI